MDANVDLRSRLERYYRLVDAGAYEEMLSLFHPEIVYERDGHPTITGADGMRSFYLGDRKIASGRHIVEVIIADEDWAVAKGSFAGTLRDGSEVVVAFADFHKFSAGLICRRYTFFAGRAI